MTRHNLISAQQADIAPPWTVERWLNAPGDLQLGDFRGRVVALHAFQMLCPGCVAHGLPQAQRIHTRFNPDDVAVVGLHTVFEHHDAMTPVSLVAFLHEYRISFPVGVDMPSDDGPTPQTMKRYRMRGTPSLILIDRLGRARYHAFGRPEDMVVGAALATLTAESAHAAQLDTSATDESALPGGCSPQGCALPGPGA